MQVMMAGMYDNCIAALKLAIMRLQLQAVQSQSSMTFKGHSHPTATTECQLPQDKAAHTTIHHGVNPWQSPPHCLGHKGKPRTQGHKDKQPPKALVTLQF